MTGGDTRRVPMTAGEFMEHLAKDEQYQRIVADQNRFRQVRIDQNFRDMAPVAAELQAAGFSINNISYLFFCEDRSRAMPILLWWLPRIENRDVKWSIVDMLTHKANRPIAAPALIEEFRTAPSKMSASQEMRFGYTGGLKWSIGNALSVVADDSVYDELVELVCDETHGRDREMLVHAIARMKNPGKTRVLISLLDDVYVAGEAARMLGVRKVAEARDKIETLLEHPDPYVREQAAKALKRIDTPRKTGRKTSPSP